MANTPQVPPPAVVFVPRRRSLFGPIVLISMGVIFLLVNMRVLRFSTVWIAFARYWPLVIILWGVIKLVEHWHARERGVPAPGIGFGGVFLLILLMFFGGVSSAVYHNSKDWNWNEIRDNIEIGDDDEWASIFVGKKFEFTENLDQVLPANTAFKVAAERGSVLVTASADDKIHVSLRKTLYADDQAEADRINDFVKPQFTTNGSQMTLDIARKGDWKGGVLDFTVQVPKKVALDLLLLRGKIEVRDRDAEVHAHNSRGDVLLENIAGNTDTHLRNGNFTARSIKGDVRIEGKIDDLNVSDVSGLVDMQGEYYGDIQIARAAKGARFKSSRTDMELARLDGELTMSGGDLRVATATGPFRIDTRSKDIHLEDLSGEVHVENSNGEVELYPSLPLANIDISNNNGSIRVGVPATAGFQLDAKAERGNVETDFDKLTKNDDGRTERLAGSLNNGSARITLSTKHGTIAVVRNDSTHAQSGLPRVKRDPGDAVDRAMDKVDRKLEEANRKMERKMKGAERKLDPVPAPPPPPDKPRLESN